jgi:hypothetical protein
MLTVLRLIRPVDVAPRVADLVEQMNARSPWAPLEFRESRGDGYASTLQDEDPLWWAHTDAAKKYLQENHDPLRAARDIGADAMVDIAFWAEDHPKVGIELSLPDDLVDALHGSRVRFAVTIYAGEYHPVYGKRPPK